MNASLVKTRTKTRTLGPTFPFPEKDKDEELDQHIFDVSGEVASPSLERFC